MVQGVKSLRQKGFGRVAEVKREGLPFQSGMLQHAALAAQLLLCALPLSAKTWQEIRPGVETKPLLVTIGHPTSIQWKVAEDPRFVTVVLDRDLHPRDAAAYEAFARIAGVAADPLYLLLSPHLEPVAASGTGVFGSLPEAAAAGLAVRRALIEGLPPAPARTPALQRFDWIGGGVFREVGEYDKLLADQAGFVASHRGTPEARMTLDFVIADLQDPSGAFVAGHRSESWTPRGALPMLIDGAHYQWSIDELRRLLGTNADLVHFHYRMSGAHAIPQEPRSLAETAAQFQSTPDDVRRIVEEARIKLLDVRSTRPKPQWHPLFVTESNGRTVSELARAAIETGERRYADAAGRAVRDVLQRNLRRGTLFRAADVPASRDDFSALIGGLLDLYQATFDLTLLERAIALQRLADTQPAPSVPAAVAALAPHRLDAGESENVVRLAAITADQVWVKRAGERLAAHRQIIVAGDPSRPETQRLLAAARRSGAMVFLIGGRVPPKLAAWMPYASEVVHPEKLPVAAICVNRKCGTPTDDPDQL